MSRADVVIRTDADREKVARWARNVKAGTVVTFKESKRSIPQNARLWACLTEIATQVPWHGLKLDSEDWKCVFLDALKRESRIVPNMDGNGFVNLGRSSSDLTKDEMSDLMALIEAFGANHGVTFKDGADPAELGKAA